ncbi:MAG TPA: threonine synthase [Thermoanaerobaculia bacterium]|nr:threonine synthase [Thermoanaerobaculia bacterium]
MSGSWATRLVCSRTGETAPLDQATFLSPAGAPWLVDYQLDPERGEKLRAGLPGRPWTLWRYRELLPLADFDGRVDLGEGGTPLVPLRRLAPPEVEVLVKEEEGNPSGSFKARGLSLAVNRARELGAPGVQLASAGNAALALATWAAAAGLPARVAVPEDTPATVEKRCRELGAEVLLSPGTLVEAGRMLAELGGQLWSLATLREPYRVEGKKTMGLELAEQLGWRLPEWILYPTGGGTGIVGMHKAFAELEALGLVPPGRRPRFVVVQMAGCAPLVRAFAAGLDGAPAWPDPHTRVWGLRVPQAIGDFLILRALRETRGLAVAVAEERLPAITAEVARREGLRIGPEGAACFAALADLAADGTIRPGERVVLFQTGSPDNYL